MDMKPVDSGNIESVGYDGALQRVSVKFRNGQSYTYYNVSQEIYDGLLGADSKGTYFAQKIRGLGHSRD